MTTQTLHNKTIEKINNTNPKSKQYPAKLNRTTQKTKQDHREGKQDRPKK